MIITYFIYLFIKKRTDVKTPIGHFILKPLKSQIKNHRASDGFK